ncbi:MAG: hypothetical protein V3V09_02700 [Arenicellales bacterium]
MAEKRSIPAALGIFIGPAIAYLSYHILKSGYNEFWQFACFALFFIAGHDIAKGGLSLLGLLTILLVPLIPIAMYVNQHPLTVGNHITPSSMVVFWAISALAGALLAGFSASYLSNNKHNTRLAAMATGLGVVLLVMFLA